MGILPKSSSEDLTARNNTKKTEGTGSTTNSGTSHSSSIVSPEESLEVTIGRVAFAVFLFVIAGVLGWLGYLLLNNAEANLVDEQYYSMTSKALETVQTVSRNKLQYGTRIMANVAGHSFPDAETWPYVWMDGYWDIVRNVVPTSLGTGMNLAPLVDPAVVNVTHFEDFVYGKFAEVFPNNPNMGAYSHFGKGIWVMDPSIDTVDNRYHDTTGVSIHGSERVLLAPKVQGQWKGVIDSAWVMMNVHGFNNQGKAVDAVLDCVEERALAEDPEAINCQGLSPMEPSKPPQEHLGMFGFIATPIYPANEPTKLVGFIFGLVYFSELLEQMYPGDFDGIDCVFSTDKQVFTYSLVDGSGVFAGEGDLHDSKYDEYGMSTILIEPETMSKTSETYHCSCYPNDDFALNYATGGPIYAAVGAVSIIFLVSAIFYLYDRCVRKDFNARKELFEAKRQFVRFVSHEVRTPLNSVGMGLTLMKEEIAHYLGFKSSDVLEASSNLDELNGEDTLNDKNAPAKEWFKLADEIQSNGQVAVDVLNDLLNYDKIESGSLSLDLTVIPIWLMIERTVEEFKLPLVSKGIELSFQLPEQMPKVADQKVVGDIIRLTQVLRNLMSNAIKFTPEGGKIYIEAKWLERKQKFQPRQFKIKGGFEEVTCTCSGDLVLSVKDTGAGMSAEQVKKLFRKGVQFNVNELQHGNGSGLGLYISKGIVEQHEGQLSCDSEGLGMGTVFTMIVPVYDIPKTDVDYDLEQSQFDAAFEDAKLRILIVDDALSNRKLLGRLLSKKGHKSDQAEDGDIAVDMVKEAEKLGNPYDIVLLDYEMPKMSGPEAASIMRKNGSDVFIAGVTGNIMPEDTDYFHRCGANAILPKPFKIAALEELIFEHHIVGSFDPKEERKDSY